MGMAPDAQEQEQRLWRRQLWLVGAAVATFVVCVGLVAVTLGLTAGDGGGSIDGVLRPRRSLANPAMWPAVLALVCVGVLIAAVVAHTIRVAAFTLRKGDDS